MPFLRGSGAGAGYLILNVIRVLNIIALLAVIAASCVMLVKTFVVSKFFFFDAVSHVVSACIGTALIFTELPLLRGYFARNWPLYSQDSGFVTLGSTMVVLGVSTLGNLNKSATSEASLGLPFWRLVIAAGIIVSIMGIANIFASWIFGNRREGYTARHVRRYGAVAPQKVECLERQDSTRSRAASSKYLSRANSLPSYCSRSGTMRSSDGRRTPSGQSQGSASQRFPVISGPYSQEPEVKSPVVDIQAPNLAHHPAMYSGPVI